MHIIMTRCAVRHKNLLGTKPLSIDFRPILIKIINSSNKN